MTPKGRTLRKDDKDESAPRPGPVKVGNDAGGQPPGPASLTPFGGFGPEANALTASAEESRQKSMSVFVIVGGIVFAILSALVVALAMLLLLLVYRQVQGGQEVATEDDGPRHVRDTGFAGPITLPAPGQGPRRNPGQTGDDGKLSQRDPSLGPPPGPATVIVSREMFFQSIEVNCPSGYRDRGSFRKETKTTMKATVYNVPGDERCVVTFQGSEPAKTFISGNQTIFCTFNPVTCQNR